nr:PREDICTED: golgin subfamily A member 6-like protein 1 [Anolis carolinensis]|eukprot:XP_016849588.1 PREDICTED: golgin subfamily A member 6-like protein 1 [Anolis carolinensis]
MMTTFKFKTDRDLKDPKGTARRSSITEETNLRDMMKEMMKEIQKIQEKQDVYQKIQQEQMSDFKREIKEELGTMRKEITVIQQEIKDIKNEKKELKKTQERFQHKIKELDTKTGKIIAKQEAMEARELEFQLRLRNIQEEPGETIREKVIEILTNLLDCSEQEIKEQTDRTYRINTNFSRRNKTPRDMIVHFTKKITRDEILKTNSKKQIFYKGTKIVILKEVPSTIISRRKNYTFLIEELKKQNARYRWEREEGLMTTYKGQRYWITTEERAREFYNAIRKEKEEEMEKGQKGNKKPKRQRTESPEKEELDRKDYRLNLRNSTELINLGNVEEKPEEEEQLNREGEDEEEEGAIEEDEDNDE